MSTITSLSKTKNVLILGVLHGLNLVAKYANHILLLNKGELISEGAPKEVITAETIGSVFGIRPKIIDSDKNEIRLFF